MGNAQWETVEYMSAFSGASNNKEPRIIINFYCKKNEIHSIVAMSVGDAKRMIEGIEVALTQIAEEI